MIHTHDPYPFGGHDPYPWSIPMIHTHDPYPWSIHTSVIANPGHGLVLFLSCTMGFFSFCFTHDVAAESTRQNFETRRYVHKVSNPIPLARYCYHKGFYVCVGMMARNLQFEVYLGLWGIMNTHFSSNQPRVIHDWFQFQQRIELDFDSTTKTISQDFIEIQVHFVHYPFHTRIMPCRTPSPITTICWYSSVFNELFFELFLWLR